jgi:hypothetical protein
MCDFCRTIVVTLLLFALLVLLMMEIDRDKKERGQPWPMQMMEEPQ